MATCASCGKKLPPPFPGLVLPHATCTVCGRPICYECDAGMSKDLPPICKNCLPEVQPSMEENVSIKDKLRKNNMFERQPK